MTHIARDYYISSTLLSQLMWAANLQWTTLLRAQQPHVQAPQPLLEPLILLRRLEGKCSMPSLSSGVSHFLRREVRPFVHDHPTLLSSPPWSQWPICGCKGGTD